MSFIDDLADNYPTSGKIIQTMFGVGVLDIDDTSSFLGLTVNVKVNESAGIEATEADGAEQYDAESTASMSVPASLIANSGPQARLVYATYFNDRLFQRRQSYLEENGRTSFQVGSMVLSGRVVGRERITGLQDPVRFVFKKNSVSPLICKHMDCIVNIGLSVYCLFVCLFKAAERGRSVECSFWDQSLDDGFGAWSTEGCMLVRQGRRDAMCQCDHLTDFAIVAVSEHPVLR